MWGPETSASRSEIPFQGPVPLASVLMMFVPRAAPLGRSGGVTRGREARRERSCRTGAAAVMDAWVHFSAQSQARERLCRCGPNRKGGTGGRAEEEPREARSVHTTGVKRVNSGYGGPDGPRGADLSRPRGRQFVPAREKKDGKLRHEWASGQAARGLCVHKRPILSSLGDGGTRSVLPVTDRDRTVSSELRRHS